MDADRRRTCGFGSRKTRYSFSIFRARAVWTAMTDDPTYLAQLEPYFEGFRKAGVPEH